MARLSRSAMLAAAGLCAAAGLAQAAPSTFSSVVGSAILCRSQLDNGYFREYLSSSFGPAYKHEGGAWWFKSDATLWGVSVSDVIVSDDTSAVTFLGAVVDAAPPAVDEAVRKAAGVRHIKADNTQFPVLESGPGSKIVYFNNRSKIYCAKFKQLPPHLQGS